jgi:hypothetical protein
MGTRRAWLVALLLLVAVSPEVAAQGVARSFEQLQLLVRAGDTVSVRDSAGTETTGTIKSLSASSLVLITSGTQRELKEANVSTVVQRRADSLRNGALWGLGVGLAVGAVALLPAMCADGPCDASLAFVLPQSGAIGVGIGVGVDALITRGQVIYERPADSAAFGMAPLLGKGRRGVALSMRF